MKRPITCMHALCIVSDAKSQGNEHKRATFLHFSIFFTSREAREDKRTNAQANSQATRSPRPGILHLCAKNHKADWYSGFRVIGTETNPN